MLCRMFRYGKQCTPPLVHNIPHIGLAKENNARQGFIEDAHYERLAAEAAKDGLWMRLFIALAYNYGWRRGELIGLRTRQVSLVNRTIRLDPGTTKNNEGREVPIPGPDGSAIPELLRAALRRQTARRLCVYSRGRLTCQGLPRRVAQPMRPSRSGELLSP